MSPAAECRVDVNVACALQDVNMNILPGWHLKLQCVTSVAPYRISALLQQRGQHLNMTYGPSPPHHHPPDTVRDSTIFLCFFEEEQWMQRRKKGLFRRGLYPAASGQHRCRTSVQPPPSGLSIEEKRRRCKLCSVFSFCRSLSSPTDLLPFLCSAIHV